VSNCVRSAGVRHGPRRDQVRLTRVLIVEDERLMGELLAEVIQDEPDLDVVGVARSVADVLAYRGRTPEIVLMDYRLPDGTGAEAARIVKSRWSATRVVMLSALHDDETVLESIQAGADGFLSKDAAAHDIVVAVRAARAGETLLPPAVIVEIARRVTLARAAPDPAHRIEPLTGREREILCEMASGRSTREICDRCGMSPNTLRTHVQHILAKLGAHSKLEAVTVALRLGLVELPRDASRAADPGAGTPRSLPDPATGRSRGA